MFSSDDVFWCSNCLNMSTRPRIEFDEEKVCNACQWSERKKFVDWRQRQDQLRQLVEAAKQKKKSFDCIVPVSGGKDGSFVAHTLRTEYQANVLTVTVAPPLPSRIGRQNLENFIESGFNHLQITPNPEAMRKLNKLGLLEMGSPYFGWLVAIEASVIRLAVDLDVPLVVYGEDGELEYGGSTETAEQPFHDAEYIKRVYFEGGYEEVIDKAELNVGDILFFSFPDDEKMKMADTKITWMSHFYPWDSYSNYLVAKEFCGLKESDTVNEGTFTNFAQNDQLLYPLHTYLMYLKFGFGRANQDSGIEIRRGAMTRDQAKSLISLYDGQYPSELIPEYLKYYGMSEREFQDTLDKWANRSLFKKENGFWQPRFEIK